MVDEYQAGGLEMGDGRDVGGGEIIYGTIFYIGYFEVGKVRIKVEQARELKDDAGAGDSRQFNQLKAVLEL